MKKFVKKTEGFTLVELIVVIAILGILAGVGTVGYSGYIKKANEAADSQLLATVNHAFATACIENGVDARSYHDGSVTAKLTEGKVTEVSKHNESFAKYYVGNENSAFKNIGKLVFENGMFIAMDPTGESLTPAQQAALDRFNNSNMQGKAVELANAVDNISGLFVSGFLGGTDAANSVASLENHFSPEEFLAFKEEYGLDENASSTKVANSTILYVASKAPSMNAQKMMNTIKSDPANAVETLMNENGMIPTAAMMYGVITGYANSNYASDTFKAAYGTAPTGISDVTNLFNQMAGEANFNAYAASETKGAQADMDGYLGAMQVISNYEDSFDVNDANTFNNEKAMKLLNTILGAA